MCTARTNALFPSNRSQLYPIKAMRKKPKLDAYRRVFHAAIFTAGTSAVYGTDGYLSIRYY